jgi:hypothetical protein
MTESQWATSNHPWEMLGFLRSRTGKASLRARWGGERLERKLRLFLAACCRRVWPLMGDERSLRAVEVAEQYVEGAVHAVDLRAAAASAATAYAEVRATSDARAYCAACAAAEVARADFRGGFYLCTYGAEAAAMAPAAPRDSAGPRAGYDQAILGAEGAAQAGLLRCIFGNPFRLVTFSPGWRTADVSELATAIYGDRTFEGMPILADALMDAGCDSAEIIAHCRGAGPHVRGCCVVDLILGKQ